MKFTNKLNLIIKIQLFICLDLNLNFGFANTNTEGHTSNSKLQYRWGIILMSIGSEKK